MTVEPISPNTNQEEIPRQTRYLSHAIVELRKFKYLPVFIKSAILLDISLGGFKIEFTADLSITPGLGYWLEMPLSPLGIYAPKKLICKCECRWFDPSQMRMGGVFTQEDRSTQILLEQIVETLKERDDLF